MSNSIFRKKSLDRISEPEDLHEYIHATNPGVWLLIVAIIAVLAGCFIFGMAKKVETTVTLGALKRGDGLDVFVPEEYDTRMKTGLPVRIDGKEYRVDEFDGNGLEYLGVFDETPDTMTLNALHISGMNEDAWGYIAHVVTDGTESEDKVYTVEVVLESVTPLSFVFNASEGIEVR